MAEETKQNCIEETPKGLGVWAELCLYVGVFLLTFLLFFAVKPLLNVQRKGAIAQTVIALGLAGCIAFVAYLGMTKRLTAGRILFVMLLAGYLLRVGYMLYTPANCRQQDTFSKNYDGHEAYAWTIFSTGKLPTSNAYQFYHPPLNAFLQAGFMRIISAISELIGFSDKFLSYFMDGKPDYMEEERYFLYSTCQILSVFYSFMTAVLLVKTVNLFSFSNKTKLLVWAFVIFYPRQIQFAGQLNNDALAYLLSAAALYCALRWQKGRRGIFPLILCAACVGLGMMTKLSSATVCLPIAGVFVYEGIRSLRKKEGALPATKTLAQYLVFLAICAPLGLWFQVYAQARFDQPFGFVFSNLNRKLYTGDHAFFTRFIFTLDAEEYFGSLYCRPFEGNYFLFNYALRSSIFGEFSYWQGEGFAVTAIVTAYLAAACLAVSLVWAIVVCARTRKREDGVWKRTGFSFADLLFVFLLVQSQVLSEIYFYIQMPYGCTMDFRYIMPLILGMGLLLGGVRKTLCVEGGKFSTQMNRMTTLAVGAFLISSMLFYCVCI